MLADAQPHVGGQLLIGNDTIQLAAALGDGDIGTRDKHARARDMACIDRILQRDIGQSAIGADIAHRRETCLQRDFGIMRADQRGRGR